MNPSSANAKNEVSMKMFANNDGTFEKVTKVVPEPQRLMTMLESSERSFSLAGGPMVWARSISPGGGKIWFAITITFPQIRAFWKTAWEVAMELRSQKTFAQAIQLVMTTEAWQDALARWAPPDQTKGSQKGKDKGDGKGKWPRTSLYGQPAAPGLPPPSQKQPCRLFAAGYCKFGANCKFSHTVQPRQVPPAVPPPPQG